MRKFFVRVRLLHILLGTLLVVGVLPLLLAGWLFSTKSDESLRSVEGRYQAQLVQDKARQISLYIRHYKDLVTALARGFELSGTANSLSLEGETRLQKTLEDDPNLIALAILPVSGEPRRAFQPDLIDREELNQRVGEVLARMDGHSTIISRPRIIRSGQEMAFTVAAPVMGGEESSEVLGAVVAVISFDEIFASVRQKESRKERDLLEAGLPVVFVVDRIGRAVAHPDAGVAFSEQNMTSLRVVQEWIANGSHVQLALFPFLLTREDGSVNMLGSYATVEIDKTERLGVIAIQDEDAAFVSIAEMRRKTVMISLAVATFALIVGFLMAKNLTQPVQELAFAARRIAAGDFSQRISPKNYLELFELSNSFNLMTDKVEQYIKDLQGAADKNRELFLSTVKALAAAIDGKDPYTRGHSERVARFAVAISQRLGLSEDETEKVRISALLHDVGKIGIDDKILKKPAPLTSDEYEVMKGHPKKGYRIMSQIPAMRQFLPGMYMHHERLDGLGYPQGLKGDEIPMQARIISVADTFDAMTTDRPYQAAMTFDEALETINTHVGTRYDSVVVTALFDACKEGQIRPGSARLSYKNRQKEQLEEAEQLEQAEQSEIVS
jgi:HD-GYP domain-containing protein (c-di-GMP phosphodiesterase class II)/sensor domain CHASE-containing protein